MLGLNTTEPIPSMASNLHDLPNPSVSSRYLYPKHHSRDKQSKAFRRRAGVPRWRPRRRHVYNTGELSIVHRRHHRAVEVVAPLAGRKTLTNVGRSVMLINLELVL